MKHDPNIIDRASRPRERANDVIGIKNEGMSTEEDEEVRHENLSYDHENGELYAEDVSQHMIVLPESLYLQQRLLLTTFKWETPDYYCQNIRRSCDSWSEKVDIYLSVKEMFFLL